MKLEAIEDRIHETGGSATIAPLDLVADNGIGRLAQAIEGRWGRLDALVLNAAMLGSLGPVSAIDVKEFGKLIALNIVAQQQLIAAFDPLLRQSQRASVVALTSGVATAPRAYWAPYAASKAALENLVLSYGMEVARLSKVRTLIVDPGRTRTDMRAEAYPGEDPATVKSPSVVADALAMRLAAGHEDGERLTVEG